MKTGLILAACCLVLGSLASAADHVLPELNSLRTPASPAFTILGISPTDVERPMTPGSVGATLLQSTNNLTELPDDFSMEVAPYWLFSHPTKSWRDDDERSVGESLARTFSVSVATSQAGEDTTSLALGLRASLLSGKYSELFRGQMKRLNARLDSISHEIAVFTQQHGRFPTDEEITAIKQELVDEGLKNINYERIGWFWEVAVAGAVDFPEDTVSRHRNDGWAAWTTVSHEWKRLSILGVARYQNNPRIAREAVGDFGGRVVLKSPRLNASLEFVMRTMENERPRSRTVALLEFPVRDDTWLSFSFGEDYDNAQPNSLIAKLGLNINFDQGPRIEKEPPADQE